MRFRSLAIVCLVGALASGCTSSGFEALVPKSNEVTGSILRPRAPVSYDNPAQMGGMLADVADSESVLVSAVRPQTNLIETPALQAVDIVTSDTFSASAPSMEVASLMQPEPVAAALIATPAARPAVFQRDTIHRRRFRDAKPINFGARSPGNLPVHGVDVSRWQGDIDWARLRTQGANFAYIKATDGGDHLDPMFKTNWRGADKAGLRRGAYHFFYWCRPASEQADWFIRNVPKVKGALPPVIDVEWNGQSRCKRRPTPEQVREKMQVFMDRLERHYGQRPVIYTAPDFYADNLRGAFPNHPFWLRAVAQHPSKVYGNRKWVFWQYSGSGLSHGVSSRIDLNVFNGSEDGWHSWLGRNVH